MSLAERLAKSPLQNVEVLALCSGCEEVGAHRVLDFLKRHKSEFPDLTAINLDNVGGKGVGVCYITLEGMLVPCQPSPELVNLADQVRAERHDLGAYSTPFTTLGTDATCLMLHKVPSMSFVGLTPDGLLPDWHQVTDTFERVDATPIEHTEEFVLEMLRRLK